MLQEKKQVKYLIIGINIIDTTIEMMQIIYVYKCAY